MNGFWFVPSLRSLSFFIEVGHLFFHSMKNVWIDRGSAQELSNYMLRAHVSVFSREIELASSSEGHLNRI